MSTTLERLSTMISKDYQLEPGVLTPDATFEILGIDSLGTVELLFNVEDMFKITIPSRPVELVTLADMVRYIDELVAAQQTNVGSVGAGSVSISSET